MDRLAQIEGLIQSGHAASAIEQLSAIAAKDIFRAQMAKFAQLAWRAGIADRGLRWLHPIVRAEGKLLRPASTAEIAEYAQCLIQIGSIEEAEALLCDLSAEEYPRVLFYRASALVSQWRYPEAVPPLEAYLNCPQITDYEREVAQANQAAAAAFTGESEKALSILSPLVHATRSSQRWLLYGRCLQIQAQVLVRCRRWEEVERCLSTAQESLAHSGDWHQFLVHKWRVISRFVETQGQDDGEIQELKHIAATRRNWETIRQCDSYSVTVRNDVATLKHLLFGTPSHAFRSQLLCEYGKPYQWPDEYLWTLGGTSPNSRVLDIGRTELFTTRSQALKAGELMQKLLFALASDFYRPLPLGAIFHRLYPHDHFHPSVSAARAHHIKFRLKKWFRENGFPLAITEHNGDYRLNSTAPFRIRIPRVLDGTDRIELAVKRLGLHFGDRAFSGTEASAYLKIPYRTTHRLLEAARQKGRLHRSGAARASRYKLVA